MVNCSYLISVVTNTAAGEQLLHYINSISIYAFGMSASEIIYMNRFGGTHN